MSLGLFKKISKSSANKQSHSYENVQATNVSSPGKNGKKKQHRNHDADYINVQFEDRNGRRHLAILGETKRQPKQSGTDASAGAVVSSTKSTDRTMPQHELAKSNRKVPKQGSGSKSWRVYSRTDSDSSSNDITDGSESPDTKKRELEHYNRLKLNPSCPPHNKKALKGIKILTNAKQQQSLQLALHSSELFKQRQQLSIPEEPRDIRDTSATAGETKQAVKYKKEGHINHLLSITGRPIRRSTSFVSLFSRTVVDVHGLHPQDNNLHMKTSKKSMRVVGKRSNSFSDIETMRVAIHESSHFSKTTTLTRTQSPLTCHTDVRYMHKSDTLSSTGSSDTLNAAWNDACPATFSYSSVPFINEVETTTFTHNGGQYTSESHDIRITIPKGAIKKHTVAHLQVGVALHGPFYFPDAKRPVSPIIRISMTPNTNLKKPIEITVPHFVKASSQSSPEKLVFLKAAYKIKSTSRRKKYEAKYHFSKVAENNQQFNSENYGTVFAKDCCFFCIVGDVSSKSTLRANYCLIPVIPKPVAQTTWRIHYYVIYLLKTYIHMVESQMCQDWEILPPRTFEFAAIPGSVEEKIEIQFQRQLLDSGWILSLESNDKISARDLDLWSDNGRNIEVLESLGMYPPRFTIRVHSQEATSSSLAIIHFSGVTDITMEVPLLQPRISISTTNPSTPTSVFSPSQPNRSSSTNISTCRQTSIHSSSCTCTECMQIFSESEDYDHLPSTEELVHTNT